MSEELVRFEPGAQLPAELQDELAEASRENMEGVTPRLPKIALPTGRSKEFSLEKFGEDSDTRKAFTGVILYQTAANAYWIEKYGTGASSPPDCGSHDGVKPSSIYNTMQAPTCAECKHNRFGTAIDQTGQKTQGKACRNLKRVVVLVQGEGMPYLMSIPPGSIKPMEEYLISLRKDKRPYWSVATEFSISTEKNKTGVEFPQVQCKTAGFINDPKVLNKIKGMRDEWSNVVKVTSFTEHDAAATIEQPAAEYTPPVGGGTEEY